MTPEDESNRDDDYWTAKASHGKAFTPEGWELTLPDPDDPESALVAEYERWCRDHDPASFPREPVGRRTVPQWFRDVAGRR